MSDEKPFAVAVGARSLRIEDWTFEAGSGNDMAASRINSAVAARERKAAAKALREAAESQIGHGEIVIMRAVRDALRSRAAAL